MNFVFFPSKPILGNKHTKKTQKIHFKNKIINLKAPFSQIPAKSSNLKATKYQINPKIQHNQPKQKISNPEKPIRHQHWWNNQTHHHHRLNNRDRERESQSNHHNDLGQIECFRREEIGEREISKERNKKSRTKSWVFSFSFFCFFTYKLGQTRRKMMNFVT